MSDNNLTDEQVKNWRIALCGLLGPYALLMPAGDIEKFRDKFRTAREVKTMSDNVANINNFTGCPYCSGSYSTAGFIHETNCPAMQGGQAIPGGVSIKRQAGDNVCPKCGHRIEYHTASGCQHGTGQGCFCNCELSANDAVHLNALAEIARLKAALEKDEKEVLMERRRAEKAERERDEAQRNHVSAVQREMITGGKLFDRETRLTTLAKELGRVQGERDAEVDDKLIAINERDEARRWAKYYRWLFIGMLPPEKDEAENG